MSIEYYKRNTDFNNLSETKLFILTVTQESDGSAMTVDLPQGFF